MFRVVLQENEFVLRGLIGSLLNLDQSKIKSTVITNPIKLGEQIDNMTFVLDIHVLLNDDTYLNLEMQVLNQYNWVDRSLNYLCRAYDKLKPGEKYRKSKRAIHIGILDFTLFKDSPEFYASYKMMNVKNHHVFSDKFILNVLDLTKIELATDEDRLCELDYWARLFKAKTWEELRMVAEKNQYMSKAAEEMYAKNADEIIREQCRVCEENLAYERYVQEQVEGMQQTIDDQQQMINDQQQAIDDQQQTIDDQQQMINDQKKKLAERDQKYEDALNLIAELQSKLSNQ